ncbi:MAG: ABC-F family ATP-binding cassette domain-containing protein [Oscillospiraceae bacterium]|nr:ABC-F family ATP-binding cassette domain-containing protein [Oscillospiraceae bacterium]
MIDISVNELIKGFEIGTNVLDGLSFNITSGEHVAILGINGAGKTCLFRILTGELDYDEGSVMIAPGKRIGLISQIPVYPDGWTTEDVLKTAHGHLFKAQARMEEIEQQLSEGAESDDLLQEYDRLQSDFQRLGGYEADAERSRVANGLDITPDMRERLFENLSGGEKTRVNLARLILEDTDILLLDEPTNHLDLHATEWLEEYVSHFRGTVLAISHDRYFLDKVAQRCIEIVNGKAEFYSGNYSFFVEERQRRFEEKQKQYEKDAAKIAQLQKAADQMHLWAFMGNDKLHKRAFSMEKRIERLKKTERPTSQKKLSIRFRETGFTGDEAVVMADISKSYGEKKLFSGLDLEIVGGESVAITGNNGTGKSSLIKVMVGEEAPDSGFAYLGPQIRAAYLPQIVRFSNDSRSMLDSMIYDCRCSPQEARDRLAAFGFRGENVLRPVGVLSGGERSRLKLCMLMGSDINLLILDEPTNHLDIASREWIEDALSDYEQTLVFVSHDRYFIDRFATRILSFEGNGIVTDYKGSYQDYLNWRERQRLFSEADRTRKAKEKKPDSRPERAPDLARSSAKIEREIEKLEAQIAKLNAEAEAAASDYLRLMELEEARKELEDKLEPLYERWEELNA